MSSEPREELISAYLDGELSAEQRAEVEKWLAESPELRQLCEELRGVSASMQALPRHKLDHYLAEDVLRRVEIAAPASAAVSPGDDQAVVLGPVQAWWSRGTWRRWAGSAAALAAALVIWMIDYQQRAPRQVAKAPQGESFVGPARDAGKMGGDVKLQLDKQVELRAADEERIDSSKAVGGADDGIAAQKRKEADDASKDRYRLTPGEKTARENQAAPSLRNLASPFQEAPAASAKPAAGAAAGSLGGRMPLPSAPTDAAKALNNAFICCEVSTDFIRDATFEKLLSKRNIAFRRGQAGQSDREPLERSLENQAAAGQPPRVDYCVEATPDQVDQIVTDLRNDKSRFRRLTNYAAYQNANTQQNAKQAPAPVVFSLQTAPAPAAPADSKAAGDKP